MAASESSASAIRFDLFDGKVVPFTLAEHLWSWAVHFDRISAAKSALAEAHAP